MKTSLTYRLVVLFLLLAGSAYAQRLKVNPKAGVNRMGVLPDPEINEVYTAGGPSGYHIGADLRIGSYQSWFFLQPGAHYYRTFFTLYVRGTGTGPGSVTSADVPVNTLRFPLNGGIYLSGTDGIVRVRTNAGVVPSVLLGVGESRLNADDTRFRNFGLGVNAGIGFDIAFITLDVGYEYDLSRMYERGNGRADVFSITAGVVIPPTF